MATPIRNNKSTIATFRTAVVVNDIITLAKHDNYVLVDTDTINAPTTLYLPNTNLYDGLQHYIKQTGSYDLVVDGNGVNIYTNNSTNTSYTFPSTLGEGGLFVFFSDKNYWVLFKLVQA